MTWYAVLNESGAVISEGTEVAEVLPPGWRAIAVDGPSDGRSWDVQGDCWGTAPTADPMQADVLTQLAEDLTEVRARVDAIANALNIDGGTP